MEFKLPELQQALNKREGAEGEASCFGNLTPRSVLTAISRSIAQGHLDYTSSEPAFEEFSGHGIHLGSRSMFPPPEIMAQGFVGLGREVHPVSEGLSKVYAKLSRLEMEQPASQGPLYKMPKRAPKKQRRKPFDISAYAKDFLTSVADTPSLRKSRTNLAKDFVALRRPQVESSTSAVAGFLKARSVPTLMDKSPTLPVPTSSPSEQGKMVLPAMISKGKVLRSGDPSFMNRFAHKVDTSLQCNSFHSLSKRPTSPSELASKSVPYFTHFPAVKKKRQIFKTERKASDTAVKQDVKREYLKLTSNTSTKAVKSRKDDTLNDLTKIYCDVRVDKAENGKNALNKKEISVPKEEKKRAVKERQTPAKDLDANLQEASEPSNGLSHEAEKKMDTSHNSVTTQLISSTLTPSDEEFFSAEETLPSTIDFTAKEVDLKFPKRRKLDPIKYRLPKAQMVDGALQSSNISSGLPKMLPPIFTGDLLVASTNNSLQRLRRGRFATDADDECENNVTYNLDRPKKYRKQPQFYSSGSETEGIGRRNGGAKRRKKRKRPNQKTVEEDKIKLSEKAALASSRQIKQKELQIQSGGGGEFVDLPPTYTSSSGSKDKNLRNTTSESIISRYITDMTRRGHIADPEDGDDELEDDDYDFSKVSLT